MASSDVQQVRNLFPAVNSNNQRPNYSYSNLIELALLSSRTGQLTVDDIYAFIRDNFPYFRIAPYGWKNEIRHALSLNRNFLKIEIHNENGEIPTC